MTLQLADTVRCLDLGALIVCLTRQFARLADVRLLTVLIGQPLHIRTLAMMPGHFVFLFPLIGVIFSTRC